MLFSSVLLEVVGILASCNLGLSLPMLFAMLRFFVDKWCCFIDSNSSRSFCSCYIYIYIYIYNWLPYGAFYPNVFGGRIPQRALDLGC